MGVDLDNGGQVSVEDVLARWDPVDETKDSPPPEKNGHNGDLHTDLRTLTSPHRSKLEAHLLGISPLALEECLPHLDVGDAVEVCTSGAEASSSSTPFGQAREVFTDVLSGRRVLSSDSYGPWSTRYCGHQFGSWAGQLGDGRAISVLETSSDSGGRQEIQLKGAGRTPFSRTADGLAVLRSGVREFLGCEGELRGYYMT